MSEPEEPEYDPSDEEVRQWVEQNDQKRGVSEAGEPVPIELSDKARGLLQEQEQANEAEAHEQEKPPPESPENPMFGDNLPTQQKAMEFAMDHKSLGKIEATEQERSLYWKAILNEVPVIFDLTIMDKIPVKVQSLSVYDLDVVLEAANADLKEKKIPDGLPAFTGRAQTYAAMMQVLKFNGKDQPDLTFRRDPVKGYPPLAESVEGLREAYDARKYLHDHPRWNAMIAAVRLFEAKCKICNDNLLNKNFWPPASTA